MLLRVSSEIGGAGADLKAVTQSGADSGVPHGGALTTFAEAAVRAGADLASARQALLDAMGPEAVVDAAAVVANFQRMVRIADGTGIPLDRPVAVFTADLRKDLGIDSYGAAANTPPVSGVLRWLGRAAQPLVRRIMRGYAKSAAP